MALAIALVLLVIGTVVFHVASPWWFTPIASNWGMMDDTVKLTFWVTGAVFVAVNLFMAYCVVRYRHRKGREQRSEYEPENRKLEWWLTILTSVGVAAMLAPGLFVWAKFVTVPDDAVEVEAVGQQWTWSYRLPGEDGVLGATDASFVTVTNPFGMDASDDKGRDDVLVADPELHLPIRPAGQDVAALEGRAAQLHGGRVPREDGPRPGNGHLYVAHAVAPGHVRRALRGTVRGRAFRHARPRGGRLRRGIQDVAGEAADVRGSSRPARHRMRSRARRRLRPAPLATGRTARATRR